MLLLSLTTIMAHANVGDVLRATRETPRPHAVASTPTAIRATLNAVLTDDTNAVGYAAHGPCTSFNLKQLNDLEVLMVGARSADVVAKTTGARLPIHADAASLAREHAAESALLQKLRDSRDPAFAVVHAALRDSKCAAVAMAWVHHLSASSREELALLALELPRLPTRGAADHHIPALLAAGHEATARKVEAKVSCEIGHNAQAKEPSPWAGFPAWPDEVTYNASGYGPYPFWCNDCAFAGSLTEGAPLQVWWSALKNAERLDHNGACSMTGFGPDHEPIEVADGPCTHLFLNDSYAYLYKQDGSFCCQSSGPKAVCHLSRPQFDFYKVFGAPTVEHNYTSESGYYHGDVKRYTLHLTNPPNFWFWYITDMEGP